MVDFNRDVFACIPSYAAVFLRKCSKQTTDDVDCNSVSPIRLLIFLIFFGIFYLGNGRVDRGDGS